MTDNTAPQEAVAEAPITSPEERAFYEQHAEAAAPETPESQVVEVDDTGEDDGDADKPENKGKFVRHGAFHQERERRKALESRLQERDVEFAKVNERLSILAEAMKPQRAQEETYTPDVETDPIGYIKLLGEQLKQSSQQAEEMRRSAQQDAESRQIVNSYQSDAARFAQETPDFKDAYGHLMQGRDHELTLYGIADPQQRAQIIHQEEQQLVRSAISQGRRPAQVAYELAKARGFSGAPASPATSPQEEVQRIAEASKANRSLSNMSGSGAKTTLTAQDLLSMSDKEFASIEESVKRRLMGG